MTADIPAHAGATKQTLSDLYRERVEVQTASNDQALKSQLDLMKVLKDSVDYINESDVHMEIDVRKYSSQSSSSYGDQKKDEDGRRVLTLHIKKDDKQIGKVNVGISQKSEETDGFSLVFVDPENKDETSGRFEINDDQIAGFSEKFSQGIVEMLAAKEKPKTEISSSKIETVFKLG